MKLKTHPNTQKNIQVKYVLLSLLIFTISTSIFAGFDMTVPLTKMDITSIKNNLIPFGPNQSQCIVPEITRFIKYYGLDSSDHFSIGTINAGNYKCVVYYFEPDTAKNTVLIIHGYLDNAGILSNLQRHLLDNGYAVIMIDLPGHGLSTGKRGDISDFEDYVPIVDSVIGYHKRYKLPGKLSLFGHSLGGGVILEKLRIGKNWNGKTILFAPVVRSKMWRLSKMGYAIVRHFTDDTRRVYQKNSHDNKFLDFLKQEPLRIDRFPLTWSPAFFNWNSRIEKSSFVDEKDFFIIQGTSDGTVDTRYNTRFYRKHFPSVKIIEIKKARHHLLNETPYYLKLVFEVLDEILVIEDVGSKVGLKSN